MDARIKAELKELTHHLVEARIEADTIRQHYQVAEALIDQLKNEKDQWRNCADHLADILRHISIHPDFQAIDLALEGYEELRYEMP